VEATDEFSDLSPRATLVVGVAGLFAAFGTLIGLAGLLMWGIKAFDMFAPGPGDAPILVESFAPYLTVINFVLTVVITVCGLMNLSLVMRWHEFLEGGWRRYLLLSAISVAAALLFMAAPDVASTL
jgi:hypothetical protein